MAFELIFAFDEVISLGHKENVTIAQVKQYTEMESTAEKQYKADMLSKINETKDLMKKKAQEIEKLRMSINNGFPEMGRMGGGGGFGAPVSSGPEPGRAGGSLAAPSKGMGMKLGKSTKTNQFLESLKAEGENIVEDVMSAAAGPGLAGAGAGGPAAFVATDPITILVEEKLVAVWKRDGGLENMEVQGTMALTVLKEEDAFIRIQVRLARVEEYVESFGLENMEVQGTMALTVLKEEDAFIRIQVRSGGTVAAVWAGMCGEFIDGGHDKSFQFKTHPNIDKALYGSQNYPGPQGPQRPFPTGSPLGILKWRMQSKDETVVPISSMSRSPSSLTPQVLAISSLLAIGAGAGRSTAGRRCRCADTYVNIEYEATQAFDLRHVVVEIPLPALREAPTLKDYDGEPRYDSRRSVLEWCIDLIDNSNRK
ncbi:unnamed protein product [Closterium sp. NIES-64]|nr:unnamed protein product [Closterium sp. NIES-64]